MKIEKLSPRKEGGRLIIEPVPPTSLLAVLDKLSPIREKFPRIVELGTGKPPG